MSNESNLHNFFSPIEKLEIDYETIYRKTMARMHKNLNQYKRLNSLFDEEDNQYHKMIKFYEKTCPNFKLNQTKLYHFFKNPFKKKRELVSYRPSVKGFSIRKTIKEINDFNLDSRKSHIYTPTKKPQEIIKNNEKSRKKVIITSSNNNFKKLYPNQNSMNINISKFQNSLNENEKNTHRFSLLNLSQKRNKNIISLQKSEMFLSKSPKKKKFQIKKELKDMMIKCDNSYKFNQYHFKGLEARIKYNNIRSNGINSRIIIS